MPPRKPEIGQEAEAKVPLLGLVLAGGSSTRMGRDKGAIEYDGQPAAARCVELLRGYCEEAFVSVRRDQLDAAPYSELPCIADRFDGFGPIGGVLSAMLARPDAAWLVLACDMPNVNGDTLRALLDGRNPLRAATCFPASDGGPEPLCTVYEPKSAQYLFDRMSAGDGSLRRMLRTGPAEILDAPDGETLLRVNSEVDRAAYVAKAPRR